MRTLLALGVIFGFGISAFADDAIDVRPSRIATIICLQGNTSVKIEGASSELKIVRVTVGDGGYEIFKAGYIVASCDNIIVN